MPRDTVAAVIPNKNSEATLAKTLDSLRFCDEVIIVDMFSTDRSKQIALAYPNVRFFERVDYIYANFNYGAEQARSNWIIRLDSDEVLSPELQQSIIRVLESPEPRHNSYEAKCHLYFFGKRLRHGFGNGARTTLFRKGTASYPCRSEHEGLTLTGTAGRLDGHYDHFTNPTVSRWMEKTNYYTDRDVERAGHAKPLGRLRLIYTTLRLWQRLYLGPGWMFRDGYVGLVVSGLAAFAFFMQECKVWEKHEASSAPARDSTQED